MEEKESKDEGKKTSVGLEENIEGALAYLLGFVTGIVFLLIEKESQFVRFHAMQSTVTFIVIFIVNVILGYIPFIGWALNSIVSLVALILWLLGMYKAYKGELYKFPIFGDIAESQLGKL
ncbi:MAG: DUF4870 domain-containing protein [Archaeoglobus sp.]|nr:DUF4870 domain-containing protein [Archaeoglobus sp.]